MKKERRYGAVGNKEFIEYLGICGKTSGVSKNTLIRLERLKKWNENIKDMVTYLDNRNVDMNTITIYLDLIMSKGFNLGECNRITVAYIKKFENMLIMRNYTEVMKIISKKLRSSNDVYTFEDSLRYYLEYRVGVR